MKLNEFISARYGCSFPVRLNRAAIEYYRKNSKSARCDYIFEHMLQTKRFELSPDDVRFMCEVSPDVFAEMFEAYLWAAYEDFRVNQRNPKGFVIVLDFDG